MPVDVGHLDLLNPTKLGGNMDQEKKPKWKPLGTQVPQGSRYDPRGDTGKKFAPETSKDGGVIIEKKPWKKPKSK